MAQRQFRSDDSSVWTDRYGAGSAGVLSQNTGSDGTANTSCTGSSSTLTVGSSSGFSNGNLVLILQSTGSGADSNPNWELNKILSGGGTTTWTMAYPLTNTYATGAQVYLLNQYSTATINTGQTLTGYTWNGTTGGLYVILANTSISVAGTINVSGLGYRGGSNGNNSGNYNSGSTAGEGYNGTVSSTNSSSANANGGGSGAAGLTNASSGGGNALTGSGPNGGGSVGNAGLTFAVFGGGGGGLSRDNASSSGSSGGGTVILIAPIITVTGSIITNSATTTLASAGGSASGSAGTGAGGNVLFKGQQITLGSSLVMATAAASGGGSKSGGQGSVGRIHVDYGISVSGTTNPTADTRQDASLLTSGGGGFLYNMLN